MTKVFDPVHGFIHFDGLESKLIDSLPFQRLRYIHQLGIAHLVYPGATHTRFEHSLGVMELASRIYDKLEAEGDAEYWRKILRLAALCHDLGHLPFSHVAEKALLGAEGHEKWTLECIKSSYLKPIWESKRMMEDVIKISVGEDKLKSLGLNFKFSPWERLVSEIITGDFFGADRIDYLLRDAQCTGVSYGLFDYHQLIEMIRVLPSFVLGIDENGIESCEALLLARHFMHRRVYQYSSVKSYSFHLTRFMKETFEVKNLDHYLSMSDNEVLTAIFQSVGSNLDAECIMRREKRYKAVKLPENFGEKQCEELKKKLKIPDEKIGWEISQKKKTKIGLSFPVLRRNQTVVDASQISDLSIPSGAASWIYIDPTYQTALDSRLSLN